MTATETILAPIAVEPYGKDNKKISSLACKWSYQKGFTLGDCLYTWLKSKRNFSINEGSCKNSPLLKISGAGNIEVNLQPGLKSFRKHQLSIAAGHYVLHYLVPLKREQFDQQANLVVGLHPQNNEEERARYEATCFGMEMLLPNDEMKKHLNAGSKINDIARMAGLDPHLVHLHIKKTLI